jgi:hypothetical protein
MPPGRDIRLQEDDDGWRAVDEESGLTGNGDSAREALAVLEARLETREDETIDLAAVTDAPADATETDGESDDAEWSDTDGTTDDPGLVDVDGLNITISPKIELGFGAAAIGIGGLYLLVGNTAGTLLIVIGVMLLLRVAWIEYGLFGR